MIDATVGRAAIEVFSYADTVVGIAVGAVVGAVFTTQINHIKLRSRFANAIARQKQRCRRLRDDEELTYDESLERFAAQIIERVQEEVAPM